MAPTLARDEPVMLLVPHGTYWSEVTPKCFIGLDVHDGTVVEGAGLPELTAHVIHRAIYKHRPDVQSVMHTHATYATVLAVLGDSRLKMIHQNSTRYFRNVAYDDFYDAVPDDENSECDRIARQLGDKEVLVMGHHGLLTVADSVPLAFDLHYYFEQAAKVQVPWTYGKGWPWTP
jgi:ribulose-5-phosphate 4-epimerase/fuculose-1-phosphate aldolase